MGERFDRELTAENLFAIQSEISNKIAEALQAALTEDETGPGERHPDQQPDGLRGLFARQAADDLASR